MEQTPAHPDEAVLLDEDELAVVQQPARIQMEHSKQFFEVGKVWTGIRKKYVHSVRKIRARVPQLNANKRIKRVLDGIAREIEHAGTSRSIMIERHDDWMEDIEIAMSSIRSEFKDVKRAHKGLKVEEKKADFERSFLVQTKETVKAAVGAQMMIKKLIKDLKQHVDAQ